MRTGDALRVFSEIINFMIFIYFTITLLKLNALDVRGLMISAFGLFASLVSDIISALESK